MGLPRFGVHQNSYEALKKFNHGGAYLGRGWIVTLLRSTIGALVESASAITPHQTDHDAPSAPRGAIAIRSAKCRIAKAATGMRRPSLS